MEAWVDPVTRSNIGGGGALAIIVTDWSPSSAVSSMADTVKVADDLPAGMTTDDGMKTWEGCVEPTWIVSGWEMSAVGRKIVPVVLCPSVMDELARDTVRPSGTERSSSGSNRRPRGRKMLLRVL